MPKNKVVAEVVAAVELALEEERKQWASKVRVVARWPLLRLMTRVPTLWQLRAADREHAAHVEQLRAVLQQREEQNA